MKILKYPSLNSNLVIMLGFQNTKSKLSNIVKNEIVKKTVYDKLVTKVNNIDTSGFTMQVKQS